MEKKSQHYIPKFYLRNFKSIYDSRNRIWVFERDQPFEPYLIAPKKIACGIDYYSLSDDSEELRILIEKEFEKLESQASQVINKIINTRTIVLTNKEKAILSEFIVYMDTRVPNFRNMHDEYLEDIYKIKTEIATAHVPVLNKAAYDLTRDGKDLWDCLKINIPRQSSLISMLKISKDLIKYPFMMNWEFLISPKDIKFITTDNPIILTVPNRNYSIYGIGYKTINVHLLFPLSPEVCLLGRYNRKKDFRYKMISSEKVRWINQEISSRCTKYVFSSTDQIYLPKELMERVERIKDNINKFRG